MVGCDMYNVREKERENITNMNEYTMCDLM